MIKLQRPELREDHLPLLDDAVSFLVRAGEEETDVSGVRIQNADLSGLPLSRIGFQEVIFEKCNLVDCVLEKTSYIDVVFRGCDLSNSSLTDAYFNRCHLSTCKGMGTDLQNSQFKQFLMEDCQFQYASLDRAGFQWARLEDCDFSDSLFTECKIKKLEISRTKLINANFFRTPMKDLDLREDEIGGLILSDNHGELRGAIVNALQAADLARRLGVIVK